MSKKAEDVLVRITASYSRKKNGIAFNIEWKKEMDRKEFEKICARENMIKTPKWIGIPKSEKRG